MTAGFWIKYRDGGHTGVITDSKRLADAYARLHGAEARPAEELEAYEREHGFGGAA